MTLKKTGIIKLYNLDDQKPLSTWVREEIKGLKTTKYIPQTSNGINIKTEGGLRGSQVVDKEVLGYLISIANNVYTSGEGVALFSTPCSIGNGFSITPENFLKIVALFAARKTINRTWINDVQEYMVPNINHPEYEQWNNDAIVYSLFDNRSCQASLRDIKYLGKTWQIYNEFFFMSRAEIKDLSDKHSFEPVWNDLKLHGNKEAFVYDKLQTITLSDDAAHILELGKQLVRNTFEYREMMNEEHPEFNLSSWDAGYNQTKRIAKLYDKEQFKSFRKEFLLFAARMKEGVHKFGFLYEQQNN